jgi:glycosyltransferase involved in cell wall biosynthesis
MIFSANYDDRIRVLLVGFTVPKDVNEHLCRVDRYMPVQTYKLSWSVVNSLEANGAAVDLISSAPVGVFPANSQIFFKYAKWDRYNGSWNVMAPFVNLTVIRHVTRFCACLCLLASWFVRTHGQRHRVILLYGTHSAHMFAALFLRLLCRIKTVTLVTDPPGIPVPSEGRLANLLRRMDAYIIKRALRSMDGLITLTAEMGKHYAPEVPSIVMEGILSEEDHSSRNSDGEEGNDSRDDGQFVVLYAGGVEVAYGMELLLDSFKRISSPSFRLWILGKGDFAAQIEIASQKDPRIRFVGYHPQHEVMILLRKASVLINPRPSRQDFTRFSFPSKTIEYMASGRPLISTRLPGIPEDYFPHLFVLDEETPEELSALLVRLSAMPRKELDDFGARAKAFIIDNKNATRQGARILSFLEHLLHIRRGATN